MSVHGLLRCAPMPIRRAWCRQKHRGLHLNVSQQGKGTRRCQLCGVGFGQTGEADALYLDAHERELSARACLRVEQGAQPAAWEAGAYRLVRGGLLIRDGVDMARHRIVGGEEVKVVRLRPGGAR